MLPKPRKEMCAAVKTNSMNGHTRWNCGPSRCDRIGRGRRSGQSCGPRCSCGRTRCGQRCSPRCSCGRSRCAPSGQSCSRPSPAACGPGCSCWQHTDLATLSGTASPAFPWPPLFYAHMRCYFAHFAVGKHCVTHRCGLCKWPEWPECLRHAQTGCVARPGLGLGDRADASSGGKRCMLQHNTMHKPSPERQYMLH